MRVPQRSLLAPKRPIGDINTWEGGGRFTTASWGTLGVILECLEAVLMRLGAVLGSSWGRLGFVLEWSLGVLERSLFVQG